MKKLFLLMPAVFCCLLFFISPLSSQTVIFSENMGTAGATGNPPISSFTGFQNSACSYTYAGTGDVRNSSVSSGYTGASGSNNVYLTTGRTLIISGINTLGFSGMAISYGIYSSNGLSSSSGLLVEISTSGSSYTVLAKNTSIYVFSGWLNESTTGTIPAAQNLYVRFTNTGTGIDYRIDDLSLTGTPTASSNPTPYNGWPAAYTFNNWPASSAAGTYPAAMIFHYGATGVNQPVLNDITASYNYVNSYSISSSNACASLISGQGASGISFVDRNPGNASSTGNLGEAVLALNTSCRANIQVSWLAGTISNNGTVYQLRAQYRVGTTGAYTNLPNSSIGQIRYTSPASAVSFGPITLPAACENQAVVQLRWAYYYSGTGAGTGDEIYLTNINVSSDAYPVISTISNQSICGGKSSSAVNFTSSPAGATFSWTNNNTAIGLAASGTGNIASYTTPTISAPPDRTGVITVSAALSGCTNTAAFSITVKGPQAASVWNGGASGDWFEHNNWSNCVCSSITNATVQAVSGPSFNPVISGTAAASVNNLTLNTGASLSMQNTATLNLYGSWSNNGSFNAGQGSVVLTGTAAQNIGGSATTAFYDLVLNNTLGASLGSPQQIMGGLQLNLGTFNTNNQLSLLASAGRSGRIGPINPAADIINQVTVQQYAAGGSTGWALLGSPITPALTMAAWNDNFAITCASCPNGAQNGFTSIYTYNETIAGSYSATTKYFPINAITDNLSNGKGYWVYLGTGTYTSAAINFDVTGLVAKSSCLSCSGAITMPVSKTNNTSAFDDGCNLLANPLPAPISWTALRNGNAAIDNALYVYNADLGGGAGAYATYINNVSSTTSGGITDSIPMCQGFYVHATAPATLTAGENVKVAANPALLRPANVIKPVARLVMNGPAGFSDMSTFYFEQGGLPAFQADYDAYKLVSDAPTPYIASLSGSLELSISGLPSLSNNITIPVKAFTAASDSFYFSLIKSDFPDHVCITLYDAFTNITTNLLSDTYACLLYDSTSMARFQLSFYSTPLAANVNYAQPSCTATSGGSIVAIGSSAGPWDYEWWNGNTLIKTSLNKAAADSLLYLGGGSYTIKISSAGQCDHFEQPISITQVSAASAAFISNVDTTYLAGGAQVSFYSSGISSNNYAWDFGDGIGASTLANPLYGYTTAGIYLVTLKATSSSLCRDSSSKVIAVLDNVTALLSGSAKNNRIVLAYTGNPGEYALQMDFDAPQNTSIALQDLTGNTLKAYACNNIRQQVVQIDLQGFARGAYLLKVKTHQGIEKIFKLVL